MKGVPLVGRETDEAGKAEITSAEARPAPQTVAQMATQTPVRRETPRRRGAVRAARESDGRLRITAGSPPDIMCRVALDLFAEQNYSTVTVKDIALAAGMNPSHLYYYFDNKEELFMRTIARVVEEAFDQFASVTREARTPEAVISAWIDLHIRQFVQFQKVAKMSLDYASTHNRTPHVDQAIRAFYDQEAEVLGAAIRRGIAEGEFRPVDPRDTALFISTFLDGSLFRNVMFPTFNYARAIKTMRRIVLDYLKTGAIVAGEPA